MPLSVDTLRPVTFFAGLSDAELEPILAAATLRKMAEDGFYFFQGDPAEHIFVLVTGRVKLTQASPDGQQVLLRIAGPHSLFGGVAMAQSEVYPVSAQAADESTALAWPKAAMLAWIERFPVLARNAMGLMARQAQEIQERYRQLSTERVERRLARTLLRLAAQTGKKTPEGVLIDMTLTRQDLAEMTGTTLFTVSRILSAWEEKGIVLLGRERVVIRFPHGLVTIAEDLGVE
jgi:CRP/FNR family transcriptional regulator, nitrogen oxide reductase regulator